MTSSPPTIDPPPKRRGKWFRRIGILTFLVVAARIVLWVALPKMLVTIAASHDFDLTIEEIKLSILTGRVDVWHLTLTPKRPPTTDATPPATEPNEPWIDLEYLTVDLDVSALLTGSLRLHRAEIDGLDAFIERDPSGVWSWSRLLPPDEPDPDDESVDLWERGFASPIEIEALRLQHVHLHVRDQDVASPFDHTLDLTLRLSDVGAAVRPTRLECAIAMDGVVDSMLLGATLRSDADHLAATVEVDLAGFHPRRVAPYLEPIGLRPVSRNIGATIRFDVAITSIDTPQGWSVESSLRDSSIRSDLENEIRVDALTLRVPKVDRHGAADVSLVANGLYAHASRTGANLWRTLGFEFIGAPTTEEAPPTEVPTEESSPFTVGITEVHATNLTIDLQDATPAQPVDLHAVVSNLELGPVSLGPGSLGPGPLGTTLPTRPVSIRTAISIRDVARELHAELTFDPTEPLPTWDLHLDATGVTLDAVRPYLAAASIEPTLRDGTVALDATLALQEVDADRTRIDIELDDLLVADGEVVLAAAQGHVHRFLTDRFDGSTTLGDVELRQVQFRIHKQADGVLEWPGFQIVADPSAASEEPTPADLEDPTGAPAPRLHLPSFRLVAQQLVYIDETVTPSVTLQLDDATASLVDFAIGGELGLSPAQPSALEVVVRAPGICDQLSLTGSLVSRSGPLDIDADLDLRATGVTDDLVEPFLLRAGIEPSIDQGVLAVDVRAHVQQEETTWVIDSVGSASYENRGRRALAIQNMVVDHFLIGDSSFAMSAFELEGAYADMSRDAEGRLVVGGLRFPAESPPLPPKPPVPGEADPSQTDVSESSVSYLLDRMTLRGATCDWNDRAVTPPVATTFALDGEARDLAVGGEFKPAYFRFNGSATGVADSIALDGSAIANPDDLFAQAKLEVRGARGNAIEGYLPKSPRLTLQSGNLRATFEGHLKQAPAGGRRAEFSLTDVDFRDADNESPWLTLEKAHFSAPRIDPAARVFEFGDLTTRGANLRIVRDNDGITLLGATFSNSPPPTLPGSGSVDGGSVDAGSEPEDAFAMPPLDEVLFAHHTLPTFSLGVIDIGFDQIRIEDRTTPTLSVSEGRFRLVTQRPQPLLGPEPSELDPVQISISAAARPFLDQLLIDVDLALFDLDPRVVIALKASGIHGAEFSRAFPNMADKIDATAWTDASVGAQLEVEVDPRGPARSPFDFDASSTFGASIWLSDVTLQTSPDAEPIAGIDAVDISIARATPATGDVVISTLEVTHPYASVTMEDDWIRVAGLALRRETEPSSDEPLITPPESSRPEGDDAKKGEVRIDAMVISDVTIDYRDESVTPPLRLPITDLDIEARQLSSLMLSEPRPLRFRAQAAAGSIALPKRSGGANILFDVANSATRAATSVLVGKREVKLTERPAFDSIDVAGRVTLYPTITGFVKGGVRSLELSNFAGHSEEAGVTLRDGLLDHRIDLRFMESGETALKSESTFSYLSLSEPANGPISRALKLTSPLSVVLAVLRDQAGDIRLPINLTLNPKGLSANQITGLIARSLTRLITDAIASSPFRIAGTVTDVAQLLPIPTSEPDVGPPLDVAFSPASTSLSADTIASIKTLGRELALDPTLLIEIRHTLGSEGIARIGELANPPRTRSVELAANLRQRKAELVEEQLQLAASARADHLVGQHSLAQDAVVHLREIDHQLAITETALDKTLALLQPGAERRSDQRTRDACFEVARRRLALITAILTEVAGQKAMERVRVRRPRFQRDEEILFSVVSLSRRRASR